MLSSKILAALVAVAGFASAQTEIFSDCNPMKKECEPNPAFGTEYNFNFNSTPNGDLWETLVRGIEYGPDEGAKFTLEKGQSPNLRTKFYIFGGRVDVVMKASPGKGVISSVMFLSDDLDEIDWEFVGSNDTHVSTNYYGKGDLDWRNAGWHLDENMQNEYHNYSCVWTEDALKWYVDDNLVRTLLPKDANNTKAYPQTPMRVSLALWAGGDKSLPEGTRQWAGGDIDYDAGPYYMYVKSVYVEDYSKGAKEYAWKDRSGSWDSIEVVKGNSTAYEAMHKEPEDDRPVSQKWKEDVPQTAKIAVYAGGAAVGALLLGALIFYCIRQRRRGAQEAAIAAQKSNEEYAEMERFRKNGVDPDGFTEHGSEYNARDMKKDGIVTTESYSVPASPMVGGDEKAWGGAALGAGAAAGAAAAAGNMRSPVPLLRDGAQSPRVGSPGPQSPRSPFHDGPRSPQQDRFSPGPVRSQSPMMRSQSPAMPPQGALPPIPNGQNRMGSPGPQRMQSPGPGPMSPVRSFSDNTAQAYGAQRMQTTSPMNPNRSFSQGQPPYRGPPGPQQGGEYWGGR